MAVDSQGILLFQLTQGLPFYSQVLCSRHDSEKSTGQSRELPEGRTLFVRSLDPLLAQESIARALSRFGDAELYPLSKASKSDPGRPERPGMFHAVFDESKPITKLLSGQSKGSGTVIPAKSHKSKDGATLLSAALEGRRAQYRGMDILQKCADECLVAYDIEEDVERRLEKEVIVDDEGFTLVTQGPAAVKGGVTRRSGKRKRESTATTVDFYRFPNKERIMQEAGEQSASDTTGAPTEH
ncbi:DnaJ homolog subfamily C member 19 [Babesia caballi]|uniref:DnaJ homolog subfamily C member 19 n=1 Tax=Babesia caballi TaxID=5871 RepID=A0AAV4LNN5_BABCB|nr:DnaJ homolog subfamily C member 19 [Babesia caballi]